MRNPDGTFAKGSAMQFVHGKTLSRIYSIYRNMRTRCENPNCEFYPLYGGRGITICHEWQTFQGFYADMGDPPDDMTLDRIDNDKGYYRNNCRWATKKEQSRNRRGRRMITAKGQTLTVTEWAELTGISANTLLFRLNKGWPDEKAISTKARTWRRRSEPTAERRAA